MIKKPYKISQKIGLYLFLGLVCFAIIHPWIIDSSPTEQNLSEILAMPSLQEPFGTDHLGRSMFARIGSAIRLSLAMGLVGVTVAALFGLTLGVIAGRKGGKTDVLLSLLVDGISSIPGLLMIILISILAGGTFFVLSIGVASVLWLDYFRLARVQTQNVVKGFQIQASKILGFGDWYCFRRHILPVLSSQIMTLSAYGTGQVILTLSTLGFIHIGVKPPTAELGYMATELFPHYYETPWIFFQPVLFIFLMVFSLNLISDRKNKE